MFLLRLSQFGQVNMEFEAAELHAENVFKNWSNILTG